MSDKKLLQEKLKEWINEADEEIDNTQGEQ